MDENKSGNGEQGKEQEPKPVRRNLSDRLVTLNGSTAPPKPQPWPPTLEEYAKAIDPRTSLF